MEPLNMTFNPFPVLTTERLELREITPDDAEGMFAMRSNENCMRYIPRPVARSIDDAHAVIKMITDKINAGGGINWGIHYKNDPMLIGFIGYVNMTKEDYRAEVGYMLHEPYHRKGIVDEAIKAVIRFGFHTMNLHSIEAIIHPDNIASAKLLEKNHFTRDAYFKDYQYYNGQFIDSVFYSLIKP